MRKSRIPGVTPEKQESYQYPVLLTLITLLMINYTVVTILMRDFVLMKFMRDILLIALAGLCLYKRKLGPVPGFLLLGLFVLTCIPAALRGVSLSLSFTFLRRYLLPLFLFCIVLQMDLSTQLKRFFYFILILFAVLSAWGIFQAYVLGDTFLMNIGYPHSYAPHYGRDIIGNSYYFGGFGIQRVVSTLSNPNVFALVLGCTLIFLVLGHSQFKEKKWTVVLLCIVAAAYILTFSRSNFLALGIVVVLFALPYIPYKKYIFAGVGVLGVILVIIGLVQGENGILYKLFQWVLDSFSFSDSSAAGRPGRWTAALNAVLSNPFGIGLGHVGAVAWNAGVTEQYYSCENSFLAIALDTGWLGMIAYIAFMCVPALRLKRYASIFRKRGEQDMEQLCMSGFVMVVYVLIVFLFSNHVYDMEVMAVLYVYLAVLCVIGQKKLGTDAPSGGVFAKVEKKAYTLLGNLFMAVRSLFWKRREDTVLFGAWFGNKFADNSRFLYQYLAENKKDYGLKHVVWVTRNPKVKKMLRNMGYEAHMLDSSESVRYHKTAFMHVVCNSTSDRNGTIPDIDIRYSFGAKRVNLWHGVGVVKGVGCASKEYQRRKENNKLVYAVKEDLEKIKLYRKFITGTGGWGDFYFLSPTETDTKQFEQFSYVPRNKFIQSQYPRTCPCVRLTRREQKVMDYISRFDRVVMYLPTFRTGSNKFDFSGLADQMLPVLKQENILWVQKAHSASSTSLSMEQQGHILNLEPDFDINVLMPHITLLVTDYSSAASDARFFRKPVLFYVPDLEEYTNGDNGITEEAEELMRGPQLFEPDALADALVQYIRDPESAKPQDYEAIREKYWGDEKDYHQIWTEILQAVKHS